MKVLSKLLVFWIVVLLWFPSWGQDTLPPPLKVGYTNSPPFIITETDRIQGASVWLWEQSAKALAIEYELVAMPFGAMLDSLTTGGIDVSINPLTITSDRLETMQFTAPFYASHAVIVRPRSSAGQRLWQLVSSFFSLSFLSGFLVLLFLIFVFGFLAWWFERKENTMHFRSGWKGIWDGLWWSVVTMTTVGYGDKAPKTRGGKIVALVWMFSGLLFISGITAGIASSLTVDRLTTKGEALKDYKTRAVATVALSSSATYLRDHLFRDIQLYDNLAEALNAVVDGAAEAVIYDEPILRYRLSQDQRFEQLEILPIKFNVQYYAFALPSTRQELTQALSQQMLRLTENYDWQVVLSEFDVEEGQE